MLSESAGLIFLRRLERRAQKLMGSIEVGTGDLNLIIRDYSALEARVQLLTKKLKAIQCGDCEKTMLDCQCEELED